MNLKTVRITNYKSIEDSGEFSVDDLAPAPGQPRVVVPGPA